MTREYSALLLAKKANKVEIKKAIEKAYGVNVTDVRTLIIPGKPKSRYSSGKFVVGSTSPYKKALVTLAEGEVIDFYSGI